MNNYLALTVGILSAGIGGELFVRGVVGIARWARVSAGIIGATVAAFATSSPELSVAVTAAMAGTPQISLGDALGSNVVNVSLILAIALLISGIQCPRDSMRRDFPVALIAPGIIGILALDSLLSRLDGLMLLGMFFAWAIAVILEARKQRNATEKSDERRWWLAIILCCAGLVFLIVAGRLVVVGAKGIATSFGIGDFIVGATIVAMGTSIPELATAIVSRIRGHDEVAIGTILGSNIFNTSFIVAIAAIISPISIGWLPLMTALALGTVSMALIWPTRDGHIPRGRGALLIALYMVYVVTIFQF